MCIVICFTVVLQVLFEQFKFFLNLFFLVMALSQFIPQLRVGYLYTYWAPLVSWLLDRLWLLCLAACWNRQLVEKDAFEHCACHHLSDEIHYV